MIILIECKSLEVSEKLYYYRKECEQMIVQKMIYAMENGNLIHISEVQIVLAWLVGKN